MRVADMTWMQVESYLERDDRVVLPLGSTEQHAWLSLATDALLAERVAVEAAEPLGVPVLPVLPFGVAPYFAAYPGTVTLRPDTYGSVLAEVLESLAAPGFGRVMVVNGHGGNSAGRPAAEEWAAGRGVRLLWHDWWRAPRTRTTVEEIDPVASHATWMESFPWTRVEGADPPEEPKEPVDLSDRAELDPAAMRERLGDGSFGGRYRRPDADMEAVWRVAVEETRDLLAGGWGQGAPESRGRVHGGSG